MTAPQEQGVALRDPSVIMRLNRLGSFHQSRLSFMRILMRRMARENWRFTRPVFAMDTQGVGHAVYTAHGPQRAYSLVAFAHDLPDHLRSDRVIAEAWDTTFVLFDGVPTAQDIVRLANNVPRQEAGRISAHELTLSRANRSVRLWSQVVDALACGQQPHAEQLQQVGYLMRTTAVYGSGKFGAADRRHIADRPEMAAPFQAEMLTVYLIRIFVRDLVQYHAEIRGGDQATTLEPELAEQLGIGNSTGLGMAPFLVNHPVLFNNWIQARETAIARVRAVAHPTPDELAHFHRCLEAFRLSLSYWQSEHPIQIARLRDLASDMSLLTAHLKTGPLGARLPWDRLMHWCGDALSVEGQELVASLILEPYAGLVDDLADSMADDTSRDFRLDGRMSVATVREMLCNSFGWALSHDWQAPDACARAWYVSEEKLEPRLGERHEEPIADYEQPLAPARDAATTYRALEDWPDDEVIARFLLTHPEHRLSVRRVQLLATAPYGEIRDNTIAADMLPIDMLRAKLSFFGANRFDPRSDRWLRICMFAGAPYPETLTVGNADQWVYDMR